MAPVNELGLVPPAEKFDMYASLAKLERRTDIFPPAPRDFLSVIELNTAPRDLANPDRIPLYAYTTINMESTYATVYAAAAWERVLEQDPESNPFGHVGSPFRITRPGNHEILFGDDIKADAVYFAEQGLRPRDPESLRAYHARTVWRNNATSMYVRDNVRKSLETYVAWNRPFGYNTLYFDEVQNCRQDPLSEPRKVVLPSKFT